MPRNELPESGDWEAVHACIHRQMKRLDMSLSRLSRESGISDTTIRYIGRPEKRQRSTLVALAAALGWQHGYLADVLLGAADPRAPKPVQTDTAAIHSLLRAELDATNEKIEVIGETLFAVSGKVEALLRRRQQVP